MIIVTGLNVRKTVVYTNYRGETSTRTIEIANLYWGSNEWHIEPQWLIDCFDVDKKAMRTFALKDMRPVEEVK